MKKRILSLKLNLIKATQGMYKFLKILKILTNVLIFYVCLYNLFL